MPVVMFPGITSLPHRPDHFVHRTIYAMGTTVSIQAYGPDIQLLHSAIHNAFSELRRLESLFSVYRKGSDISRINSVSGVSEVEVSEETIDVVRSACHFSSLTGGTFDCTVEPLMRLWGFRQAPVKRTDTPTEREMQQTLDAVGYKKICLDERRKRIGLLKSGAGIDLGGIAVGYSVERMAALLRAEGIERALINHSGDIYAIGAPPDTTGWPIGIPSIQNTEEIIFTTTLKDAAISTSSITDNYFEIHGKRYGHILDPISGSSVDLSRTVSVITQSSMCADVYSTALYRGKTLEIGKINGTKFEVIYVDNNGSQRNETFII